MEESTTLVSADELRRLHIKDFTAELYRAILLNENITSFEKVTFAKVIAELEADFEI